jgi:hypothetical protein
VYGETRQASEQEASFEGEGEEVISTSGSRVV